MGNFREEILPNYRAIQSLINEYARGFLAILLTLLLALIFLSFGQGGSQADPGDVMLCSTSPSGHQGNQDCWCGSISADGRYVAFSSDSDNLVPEDNNEDTDVFRKDLMTGEVLLCSCDPSCKQAEGGSGASMSADGRYVVFSSSSKNLVPGSYFEGYSIFRKDLQTGEVLLVPTGGPFSANGYYEGYTISGDGRYVAFVDRTGFSQYNQNKKIYRKDLETGEVILCSCDAYGQEGNRYSGSPSISYDGRYVAFHSWAYDLTPGDTNYQLDVYRKDLQTGAVVLCSCDSSGIVGDGGSSSPSMSSDGRYVVFESVAGNLVPGVTTSGQVYRKDLQTGEVTLCSSDSSGDEGDKTALYSSISADGRYVVFTSEATDIYPGISSGEQIYRKDLQTGDVALCSSNSAGEEGNVESLGGAISADGRYVAFSSFATNLVPQEISSRQVFRKEVSSPETYTYAYYFAEGCTLPGFQEYLCLGTTADVPITVEVTYLFLDEQSIKRTYDLPPHSRLSVNVNAEVEGGKDVSIVAESASNFSAERPMYFEYDASGEKWTGGHNTSGASATSATWYFAEGYTGPGFDEWVCVLNPGDAQANLTFRFHTQEEGEKIVEGLSVMPHSRGTFKVNDLLGGFFQTSLMLESDEPIVVERSMYFNYQGTAGWNWKGGHCVGGAPTLSRMFYFAEGTTRSGFEEWLTLQNPGNEDVLIYAQYCLHGGGNMHGEYTVPAGRRMTLFIPLEVGMEKDISTYLWSSSPFLAERPMYFDYQGCAEHSWDGGHCVIGATEKQRKWFFTEGYTGQGFEEWICLLNLEVYDTEVVINYYNEGGTTITRSHTVPANSRYTVLVNVDTGPNQTISAEVVSELPVVAERSMYFSFNGCDGGHNAVGNTP